MLKTRLGACRALLGRGLRQFWMPLGRLLAGFWLLLGGFWTLLGASWPPLGRSRAPLGSSQAPFGCILPPHDAPGLDFGGFGDTPRWVLERLGRWGLRCTCTKVRACCMKLKHVIRCEEYPGQLGSLSPFSLHSLIHAVWLQ